MKSLGRLTSVLLGCCLFFLIAFPVLVASTALAHPGRTDRYGGHSCRTRCEDWGESYGYHFHGRPDPSRGSRRTIRSPRDFDFIEPISSREKSSDRTMTIIIVVAVMAFVWLIIGRQGREFWKSVLRGENPLEDSHSNEPPEKPKEAKSYTFSEASPSMHAIPKHRQPTSERSDDPLDVETMTKTRSTEVRPEVHEKAPSKLTLVIAIAFLLITVVVALLLDI